MNRRNYIRSLLGLGVVGLTSLPIIKWLESDPPIVPQDLWKKRPLIADLAEMIIPESDTPGAKAANVDDYIINVLLNCTNSHQQQIILSGLNDLEQYTTSNFGLNFLKCNTHQKLTAMQHFSEKESFSFNILNRIEARFFGKPFFVQFKGLAVQGYCLSMLGATRGLAYEAVPGRYVSCTTMSPFQKSWATK